MALPQRARQVRSNKRPPPTPLVQPREQRDVLVEAIETAHYRLEPFAPLPVNVAEAYSRSPATLSSSRVDEDWAFAICGRFVFVWRLAEVKARPLPAISRELPPSSQPITARNVAFLKSANAGSRGLAVVTAEGHIRLWPDVEAVAVHEATVQLDAQAHVTSLTARSEPLSGAVGCSSGAVFLLQAQGYIQLTPLTRPKGMLAGIGSLLGWGRGQSQPASMHPISALLAQQSNLFVLTTGALQRWHGSTLVFEFPLQTAVENWLRDETLTDAMDATEAQVSYRVWLLRMVPGVPGETVHVLVASINALCPPDRLPILSFAVAEVDFSSTPVQLTALRAVQPADAPLIYDRRTEAEQLASVDLVATQHSLAALMTSSRVSLFRLAHADPELDVVGTMKADDAPLGGGPLGQRLAILSARGVRLAASRVSAAPPSSLPLRRFNNLAAGLDAALSGSPAVYDGPVIEQDLIQEIVARIATQASGGQEPSLLIRQQLEEKRAKFNAMFNMLTESLVWRSLSPAGARRLLDIGEQLDASVGLRSFQNNSTAKPDDQINDVFLKAMQHCVLQSRLVTADRLHSSSVQDVFYAEFSRLGDLIDSLCAVCAASSPPARRDAVDQARILRAALAILQVLLSSARKFRENPRHEVAYQTAAKESGWLFRETLRENTKRVVVMGLDALVDVARSTNADVAGIAADLADSAKDVVHFTLAFYEDQVRADNGASEQLANNWVAERFRIILPFIEKGLPDRARDLAERFTDFECLIQLSIDAPVPEVGPAPPTLIEYADRYQGHGFVEYLLRYLLTHSRPADILIVGFRFPERFAAWLKDTRRRPEEAAVVQRLGWLLGWQQGDFGRSSLELSQLAAAEEVAGNKGTLLRKKTLASLAVLSALAGGDKTAQEVASRHVDLVDRQERVLGRPATAAPLAAADVIAALLATTREVASADRTERLRIAAEAFARHCTLSSHQSLWTMMWNEILNDQRVNWAAVGARYQSGASDATFESAVRESALFQILREDFVRERQLLESENFEKLLAMRQPDERGALRRTYQLALSSRMLQ